MWDLWLGVCVCGEQSTGRGGSHAFEDPKGLADVSDGASSISVQDAMVNGKSLNTCLGDLFSVNWLTDTESTYLSA